MAVKVLVLPSCSEFHLLALYDLVSASWDNDVSVARSVVVGRLYWLVVSTFTMPKSIEHTMIYYVTFPPFDHLLIHTSFGGLGPPVYL